MEKTIRRKTTDGLIWNTLQKLASKGLQLVFSILIARILVPEDYGLIAIANLFIALSDVLIDSGFSKALIRQNDKTEADYSTVFWFNLLASCTLYALLFAVAPLIAGYYQAEALAPAYAADLSALSSGGGTALAPSNVEQVGEDEYELTFRLPTTAESGFLVIRAR